MKGSIPFESTIFMFTEDDMLGILEKKTMYHVSGSDIQVSPTGIAMLRPFDSNDPHVIHRGGEEPDVSRLCVAPSIFGCLIALSWSEHDSDILKIYKTLTPVRTSKPFGVIDAHLTGERWITKPTPFRVAYKFKCETYREMLRDISTSGDEYIEFTNELYDMVGTQYGLRIQESLLNRMKQNREKVIAIMEKV